MSSERINSFDRMIDLANGERWYTMPTFYMVEYVDNKGYGEGYFPAVFDSKKEAERFAKKIKGRVIKHINM